MTTLSFISPPVDDSLNHLPRREHLIASKSWDQVSQKITMLYNKGRCDEGINCITSDAAFSFVALSHPPNKNPAMVLREAVQKHDLLISQQTTSYTSIGEASIQHIISLYQAVATNAYCLFTKIIAENNMAQLFYQQGKYIQAHLALERAASSARYARQVNGDFPKFLSDFLIPVINNLGRVHFVLGEYEAALRYVVEALGVASRRSDEVAASLWYNMALILKLLNKGSGELLYTLNRAHHILTTDADGRPCFYHGKRLRDIVTVQAELLLAQANGAEPSTSLLMNLIKDREENGYESATLTKTLCDLGKLCLNEVKGTCGYLLASNFFGEALRIYKALHTPSEVVISPMNALGKCFQALGRYEEAMSCFDWVLLSIKGSPFESQNKGTKAILAVTLYHVGMLHISQGAGRQVSDEQKKKALKSFMLCLKLRQSCYGDEHPAVADVLHKIGIIYAEKKKDAKALKYFRKSLQIREVANGDRQSIDVAMSLRHIGKIYQDRGDYQQALTLLTEALSSMRRSQVHCTNSLVEVLVDLGQAQHSLSRLDQAQKSYEEAARLLRQSHQGGQSNGISHIVAILKILGNLSIDMSDLDSARVFFVEAAHLSGREEDFNLIVNTIPPSAAAA